MGAKIIAKREASGNVVSGILDGDFQKDWETPRGQPSVWPSKNNIKFGWRWERKEIENYLIDPAIVVKSLGDKAPDRDRYLKAIESARDCIAVYQAARTALSANRQRFHDLPSNFGPKRGQEQHPFPKAMDEIACQNGIRDVIANHRENQQIQETDVLDSFQKYLPECRPQGIRYQYYLYTFAGKDLFWAMDEWFRANGLRGAREFREKILLGIQNTTEDIATWVPEWEQLHRLIAGNLGV
ncbi:MAG: hypothetical protein HQM03_06505 [Magnetococcales bacterium]|nr:hypothetical protein [Magnetococcales bacterium]